MTRRVWYRQLFELYIALVYGDPRRERIIPFAFATELGFYIEDTGKMQREAEEAFRLEKEGYLKRLWDAFFERQKEYEAKRAMSKQIEVDNVRSDRTSRRLTHGRFASYNLPQSTKELVDTYICLHEYKNTQELLKPFYTARFARRWRDAFPQTSDVNHAILNGLGDLSKRRDFVPDWLKNRKKLPFDDEEFFHEFVLEAFRRFLEEYGEGGLVIRCFLSDVIGREPLEILQILEALQESFYQRDYARECAKYYWHQSPLR